jgi:excisionase family DNA binding protein
MPEDKTTRLLRTPAAAKYLGLSTWQLRKMINDGNLPYVQDKEGGPYMLDIVDLDKWIEQRKTKKAG